ncbi:GNAT family N-acetyltransferase [Clostridium perfringens]|uniref:GNAT family N-acetyltransferase n=1 Tax=Clostridium perfringens TaxID=1502 RepID=UPI0018AC2467|nr:GNAT family N-acetyltransferase [Clostridium perfringens]MDB2068696.1 GNAT family N-acetyltransferase [Clostridium perfringens]
MNFKSYSSIYGAKKSWLQIISNNSQNIYQTYEFNRLCYLYRITSLSNLKKGNILCDFIVGYENGVPVCIAPLVIDKKPKKCIRLLGHGTNAGYLDFIYSNEKYVNDMYEYVKTKYVEYEFEFIFVKEKSPLTKIMRSIENFNNYSIHIEDYDEYFSGLSKSTRQNIRTSYNRISKDGRTYKLCVFDKNYKDLEKVLYYCNEIYHKRKKDWLEENIEYSTKIKRKILKRDVINQSMRRLDQSIIAVLIIDNNPAAYFMGLKYDDGIYIPRLAIDMEYSRYSPGIILINEFLKKCKNYNFKSYVFDLCRGDEKYKSSLKGEITITNRLVKINKKFK